MGSPIKLTVVLSMFFHLLAPLAVLLLRQIDLSLWAHFLQQNMVNSTYVLEWLVRVKWDNAGNMQCSENRSCYYWLTDGHHTYSYRLIPMPPFGNKIGGFIEHGGKCARHYSTAQSTLCGSSLPPSSVPFLSSLLSLPLPLTLLNYLHMNPFIFKSVY